MWLSRNQWHDLHHIFFTNLNRKSKKQINFYFVSFLDELKVNKKKVHFDKCVMIECYSVEFKQQKVYNENHKMLN